LLGWVAGALLLAATAGVLALFMRVPFLLTVLATIAVTLVSALGVAIWGWVEAVHVSEGLLFFARRGMVGWARRALANGVFADTRNDLGETPLLLAAADGHVEMVKLLLLGGADPTAADHFGQTPLAVTRAKGHAAIAELLERYKPAGDPTAVDPGPVWRPDARRWLLASVVLGAVLAVAMSYLYADRRILGSEQFQELLDKQQVKEITLTDGMAWGEVKEPRQVKYLIDGKFAVRLAPEFPPNQLSQRLGRDRTEVKFALYAPYSGAWPLDCWPSNWVALPMLGWPIAVLGLAFLPLLGWPNAFPFLALRAKGRGAR
jgi:hypothetical protein